MSVIICPPPAAPTLDPEWDVPHSGFGVTSLLRNSKFVWSSFDSDECDGLTLRQLSDWCDNNARWTLYIDGPMSDESYELRRIWRLPDFLEWRLIKRGRGFA